MPAQFQVLQSQLTTLREQREDVNQKLWETANTLARLQREQQLLERTGATDVALKEKQTHVLAVQNLRQKLLHEHGVLEASVATGIADLVAMRLPEQLVGELDGGFPVAMLPVRLETRFFDDARELRIRIFPDAIHIDGHQRELTEKEAELGRAYFRTRLAGDASATATAWAELVQHLGAARASWVVQCLTPVGFDPARDALPPGAALEFPAVATRAEGVLQAPRCVALPDRWVAIGMKRQPNGEHTQLFRVWGTAVPDALQIGPSFDPQAKVSESPEEPPLDLELRWLTDYEAARQRGMAITVRDGDLSGGHKLASGIDLLVVFGVDWTLTPDQAAASLNRLFEAHAYSDGFSFLAQGTPTNNTANKRAGSTPIAGSEAPVDPVRPPAVHPVHGAAARLEAAFGFAETPALRRAPGAKLTEQRTASLLIDALWQSTLGYYLDELIDPFATDRMVGLARDHAVAHLQPFGPFTALRIGAQPYGLLPVVALSHFTPDREDGIEAPLRHLLERLAWFFRDGVRDVPRMGRSGDPDDDLLELLQQTPVSLRARYRRVLDTETTSNADSAVLKRLTQIQSAVWRSLVLPVLASYAGPDFHAARILRLSQYPTDRSMPAPFVTTALETGLEPNYIEAIAREAQGGQTGTAALRARAKKPSSLLESLLVHAAEREIGATNVRVLDKWNLDRGAIKELPAKSTLQTGTTLGIYAQPEASAAGMVFVQTPRQLATAVIPALTGTATLSDFVSKQLALPLGSQQPPVRRLSQFIESLTQLAMVPPAEIDRALRGVVDCFSYRYDAWHTSLATRRLGALRANKKQGVHVGGYGWVADLKPDRRPDSLGYVHAPSLSHAATAALLRSGNLSHRGAKSAALNIDLSSRRVRNALALLEGVAGGQPLAALLGYRFERALHDRDPRLSRFILPFRKLAPFASVAPEPESGPRENIAARDVVDGLALADRLRQGEDLIGKLDATAPDANERALLTQCLRDLNDALDAVSDVLTAEAAYQTVQGNYERAGAALAALDRQSRPPEPAVIRTPRSGARYIQRVSLVVQDTALPASWSAIATDVRARVEPRLNAWLGRVIGDPSRYRLAAEVRREGRVESLTASLAELGMGPLSLVLASATTHARGPSELELRLSQLFAARVSDAAAETELVLLDAPPPSAADAIGLDALRSLLGMLHTFVAKRRALDARDLYPAEGEPAPGVDVEELGRRLDEILRPALAAAIRQLEAAHGAGDPDGLRAALRGASELGVADSSPDTLLGDDAAVESLREQAVRVLGALQASSQALALRLERFTAPAASDPTYGVRMTEHYLGCIRAVLGEHFPVLPLFRPANVPELRASLADQAALHGGDAFAALTVVQQLATVRPDLDKLSSLLTAAEVLGQPEVTRELSIAQLPHVPGQRWAALALPDPPPLLALCLLGRFDLEAPIAGLVCDGWSELIPARKEMTGITFHYDAPAARAPQTILLAAPPQHAQARWSFEALLDSVLETWKLAQLRAVGPKQIRALSGGLLPALYLPQDNTYQIPSVDLGLFEKSAKFDAQVRGKVFHGN